MMIEEQDVSDLISKYLKKGNDFGFTTVSEEPFRSELDETKKKTKEVELSYEEAKKKVGDLESNLKKIEESIMPFLVNLMEAEHDTIIWPVKKRKPIVQDLIKKILSYTRG